MIRKNKKSLIYLALLLAVCGGGYVYWNYYPHLELDLSNTSAAGPVTLSLTPANQTVAINQIFTVSISLNTNGIPIDGVDVLYLHFNPSILQVVDDDVNQTGVQITAGTILPIAASNNSNNTTGTIQFSAVQTGSSFIGNGTLATIKFKAIAGGSSTQFFDFSSGCTNCTNAASSGINQLSTVSGSTYTVDATAPTVSITAPGSGSTVSGASVAVSANASDNIGIAGVQFKVDGNNLGSEVVSAPYTTNWNTTTFTNGTHAITAVARDSSGNTTTSSPISVTVSNIVSFQRSIQIIPEALTSKIITSNLQVLSSSKVLIKSYAFTTSSSGVATVTFDIAPQLVYLKIQVTPYLARVMSVDLNNNTTYTFPTLLVGDVDGNNTINSLDWSVLNSKWLQSDPIADFNKDGIVNSIDFSFMNSHWLTTGEI